MMELCLGTFRRGGRGGLGAFLRDDGGEEGEGDRLERGHALERKDRVHEARENVGVVKGGREDERIRYGDMYGCRR